MPTFGEELRAARQARGLLQTELAEKLGQDPQNYRTYISKLENGHGLPEPELTRRLAEILEAPDLVAIRDDEFRARTLAEGELWVSLDERLTRIERRLGIKK